MSHVESRIAESRGNEGGTTFPPLAGKTKFEFPITWILDFKFRV